MYMMIIAYFVHMGKETLSRLSEDSTDVQFSIQVCVPFCACIAYRTDRVEYPVCRELQRAFFFSLLALMNSCKS